MRIALSLLIVVATLAASFALLKHRPITKPHPEAGQVWANGPDPWCKAERVRILSVRSGFVLYRTDRYEASWPIHTLTGEFSPMWPDRFGCPAP